MVNRTDDRRRACYEEATVLTQDVLDEASLGGVITLFPLAHVNFQCVVSDRPCQEPYNGDTEPPFYEGRAEIKMVTRTLGELLNPSIQISYAEFRIANVDGFYNYMLETGEYFLNPVNLPMDLVMTLPSMEPLADRRIFTGRTSVEEPLTIEKDAITYRGSDTLALMDIPPNLKTIATSVTFPSIPDDVLGKTLPFVLGDWESGYDFVTATGSISISSSGVLYDVQLDSPDGLYGGIVGYNVGGGYFAFAYHASYTPGTIAYAHIKRGDAYMAVNFNSTPAYTGGFWVCQVTSLKKVGVGTVPYTYQSGDVLTLAVKIPYAVGQYSNMVRLVQHVIISLSPFIIGNFDTSWDTLAAKSSPAQSNLTSIKGRVWIGDNQSTVLKIACGLLEQVRLELYFKYTVLSSAISLTSLHPEDWAGPGDTFTIDQYDIAEDSFRVQSDDRTFFNRASINFGFTPITGRTQLATGVYQNSNSITLAGKTVEKVIDCPNLHIGTDAVNQLKEFLRLYSSGLSFIQLETSWVHLLRQLGEIAGVTFSVGGLDYNNTPAMVRDIGVDPRSGRVSFKLLNLATFGYTEYTPANEDRCLSSSSETISEV